MTNLNDLKKISILFADDDEIIRKAQFLIVLK